MVYREQFVLKASAPGTLMAHESQGYQQPH